VGALGVCRKRSPICVCINCENGVPEKRGWSLQITPVADATCSGFGVSCNTCTGSEKLQL
jgi:hypothetical protein